MRILMYRNYGDALNFKLETYNEEIIESIKKLVQLRFDYMRLMCDLKVDTINYSSKYMFEDLKEWIYFVIADVENGFYNEDDNYKETISLTKTICEFYRWRGKYD